MRVPPLHEYIFTKGYCNGPTFSVLSQAFWDQLLGVMEFANMPLVFGVTVGLGRIVALYHRSSTLYQIH